jgi:hypothetical protein
MKPRVTLPFLLLFAALVVAAGPAAAPSAWAQEALELPSPPRGRDRLGPRSPCAGGLRTAVVTNGTANAFKGVHLHRGSNCSVTIECDTAAGVPDGLAAFPVQLLLPGQTIAGFACPGSTALIGVRPLGAAGSFVLSFEP